MDGLFIFPTAARPDLAVERWLHEQPGYVGDLARHWFQRLRDCGDDVKELMHDGHPTACVGEAAFARVAAYTAHVNISFYRGTELADPDGLLVGDGRFMRRVRLEPRANIDTAALGRLVAAAYRDMRQRLGAA